ncbi:hypothetical protein HA402_001884 [Bradysia odoriphaga]|nr:hypothetical protein HA402_001884 [Bradysia odoriphaga]
MKEKTFTCAGIIVALFGVTAYAEFTCTKTGLFADPDSSDCKSFYACHTNTYAQKRQCPDGTYFSPELVGCFSFYKCATKSSPYTTDPCKGLNYQSIADKFSSDCSQYLYCRNTQSYYNGEYIWYSVAESMQCENGYAFNMRRGQCSLESKCTHFECTARGQFVDPNGSDCSTYIRCYKYTRRDDDNNRIATMLVPELQTCPDNTKFNPYVQKCDSFYKCNNVDKHRGKDPCAKYNPLEPYVVNPYDTTSKTYLTCEYRDSSYYEIRTIISKQKCEKNTLFSPWLIKCYNNYDPNEMCVKDACASGPGKYPNLKSGKCESFIVCQNVEMQYAGWSDQLQQQTYEPTYEIHYCPEGTNFNPKTGRCSKEYVCPTIPANYCYTPTVATSSETIVTTTAAAAAGILITWE